MDHDTKVGGLFVYFLTSAIVANETGSPLLAVVTLLFIPLMAVLVVHLHKAKQK